ncbi:hypothetical protein [Paraburkholderia solisilvae]|uniref:hypothetical protein n=1 Tax=Paraburkholderia solisilvae TaxID=624376 RepID=UPI0015817463|nr:hypothetical protein [Paraburkholderia solisilvae]
MTQARRRYIGLTKRVKAREQRMAAVGNTRLFGYGGAALELDELAFDECMKVSQIEIHRLFGVLDEHERCKLMGA